MPVLFVVYEKYTRILLTFAVSSVVVPPYARVKYIIMREDITAIYEYLHSCLPVWANFQPIMYIKFIVFMKQ